MDRKHQINLPLGKPNIVIIYTDDQGYGDVSALNPDAKFETPNIDRIAEEGMIFTDGHSSDGVCSPSRYSLLTGRYSWRTRLKKGVLGIEGPCLIEDNRTTLASILKENGYNTGMVGKWHLNMQFPGSKGNRDWGQPVTDGPNSKGFEYYWGIAASMNFGMLTYIENQKILEEPELWTGKKHIRKPYTDYRMYPPFNHQQKTDSDIEVAPSFRDENVLSDLTDKAVEYIKLCAGESKKGTPFFLYFALTSPHLPHAVHPDFIGKSECGKYGDFMTETDYRVGQVLNELDANGLTKNTLVIFTSDNGPEVNYHYQLEKFGHDCNYIFKGGKRDIYEGGHRVPFLIRWPAVVQAGLKVEKAVCQVDLLATFAEILGVKLSDSEGEDSYSLLPVFINTDNSLNRGALIHHSADGHFSIRKGKWKLNLFRGSGGSLPPVYLNPKPGEPVYELYNLQKDPGETTNLIEQYPGVASELLNRFKDIILNGRSTPGKPQGFVINDWPQLSWMDINN